MPVIPSTWEVEAGGLRVIFNYKTSSRPHGLEETFFQKVKTKNKNKIKMLGKCYRVSQCDTSGMLTVARF